ncbi:aryl-sulfate sulfotransferase [Halomicrobium salinisoli]|uniref:aryl-sulfate sulfotransferase n=1 Tax=Halomicrobium salinisoli TaxID=2878391 RepID=UPI001CEFC5B9|nr:aryl-sulfate sulfotransferase [Halomicrobium salinisoli]
MDATRAVTALLAVVTVTAGFAPAAAAAATGPAVGSSTAASGPALQTDASNPCVGTIRERPENATLLSLQGARGSSYTTALLTGIAPNGSIIGVHNVTGHGGRWAYDVDPLANGNLLMASTEPGITVVTEIDPATGEHVSVRRFEDVEDGHDADLHGDELYLVDKGDERNRVLIYNLTREEITWQYRFDEHSEAFPRDGGGPYADDWTHVNDVERIGDGLIMASIRNFDEVVAIDRETKEIAWTLGEDGNHDVLFEQHNPDYFEGENGTPTVIVADSRNDRVVEYARIEAGADVDLGANATRVNDEWVRTWTLEGGQLDDPRDADRLPNGNTLVSDRRGHRLLEVTPAGEVVWEVYGPWQPYDAERIGTGDESSGPTMREADATGTVEMTGSQGIDVDRQEQCYEYLTSSDRDDRLLPPGALDGGASDQSTTDAGGANATDQSDERVTATPALGTGSDGSDGWTVAAGLLGAAALVAAALLTRRLG